MDIPMASSFAQPEPQSAKMEFSTPFPQVPSIQLPGPRAAGANAGDCGDETAGDSGGSGRECPRAWVGRISNLALPPSRRRG